MRKCFVLSVLCFLWAWHLQGQILSRPCLSSDIEVNFEEVIWNATPTDLDSLLGIITSGTDTITLDSIGITTEIPPSFHIVKLSFVPPTFFVQNGDIYTADIAISQSNKPVFVFLENSQQGFLVDGVVNVNGHLSGFILSRIGVGMGGVATTAGIMARSGISPFCVEIAVTNRVSFLGNGTTCNLPDSYEKICKDRFSFKALTTNELSNIYPNPVRDRLFIDYKSLNSNEINIINTQGQSVNHNITIRYGTDRVEVNTSQLLSGIYFLQITTPTGKSIEKFIIH